MHFQHFIDLPHVQWAAEYGLRLLQNWLLRCLFRFAVPWTQFRWNHLLFLEDHWPCDVPSEETLLTVAVGAVEGHPARDHRWPHWGCAEESLPIQLETNLRQVLWKGIRSQTHGHSLRSPSHRGRSQRSKRTNNSICKKIDRNYFSNAN